jgi:hypothetical protein
MPASVPLLLLFGGFIAFFTFSAWQSGEMSVRGGATWTRETNPRSFLVGLIVRIGLVALAWGLAAAAALGWA